MALVTMAAACASSAPDARSETTAAPAAGQGGVTNPGGGGGQDYVATTAVQPGLAATTAQKPQALPAVRIERISSLVPWPRGIAWVDGKLIVVARGRHRNYGGPAVDVLDQEATLFELDPGISEPYEKGKPASSVTIGNGRVLAEPDPKVIPLYDRSKPPVDNWLMSRPFCTMVYDEPSRNLMFCGYSGVDMVGKDGAPPFRKNATDALFRYDLRTNAWGVVEMHRHDVVSRAAHGAWISNEYYPHHDPAKNAPPHGLLNGPNGCCVAGRWLYAVGKDNHTLARYDLDPIRKDPESGPPPAEVVLGELIDVRIGEQVQRLRVKGHSAVTANGGWLYLATRTSNIVLRFPMQDDGTLVQPIVGDLVAEFEPYTVESKRGADVWDVIANERGELFVAASREGRVWRFTPERGVPFDGNDKRATPKTPNQPWIDIRAITGNPKAGVSNMTIGRDGHFYFCCTMPEPDRPLAGIVMRAVETRG